MSRSRRQGVDRQSSSRKGGKQILSTVATPQTGINIVISVTSKMQKAVNSSSKCKGKTVQHEFQGKGACSRGRQVSMPLNASHKDSVRLESLMQHAGGPRNHVWHRNYCLSGMFRLRPSGLTVTPSPCMGRACCRFTLHGRTCGS